MMLVTDQVFKFPWKLSTTQYNTFSLLQSILTYSTKVRCGTREGSRTLRIDCGFYFLSSICQRTIYCAHIRIRTGTQLRKDFKSSA